jgi:DNA-binding transcriptional LysR family regulator
MIEGLPSSLDALREHGRLRQEILGIGCLPTIAAGHLPIALKLFQSQHPEAVVRLYDNSDRGNRRARRYWKDRIHAGRRSPLGFRYRDADA